MSKFYSLTKSEHYDVVNKEFIEVDLGSPSEPNIIKLPIFKDSWQIHLVNNGNGIYSFDNMFYVSNMGQEWQNAPNCITMFIQTASCFNIKENVDSTGKVEYDYWGIGFTSEQEDKIELAINNYFKTNINKLLAEVKFNSISSGGMNPVVNGIDSLLVCTGNEQTGTLASTFKRPSEQELNPDNITNIAQGVYPYQSGVVTPHTITNWIGQFEQFWGSSNNNYPLNRPTFEYYNQANPGLYHNNFAINNEFAGSTNPTDPLYLAVPAFYEPIDYYASGIYAQMERQDLLALYRRIYFGTRAFQPSPTKEV